MVALYFNVASGVEFKQSLVQACLLLLQEHIETGKVRLQIRVTFSFQY
jgi:hypothetical protein